MKKSKSVLSLLTASMLFVLLSLQGCSGNKNSSGVKKIEMLQYKPEAVEAFEKIEKRFNDTHDDIKLSIESPNEAMTILKTRFIREDYPDIVAIGGDINYSNFLDAEMFMDISDFDGVSKIKPVYMEIEKELEFIPQNGVYAIPFVANAAGVLYNKDMFQKQGWKIPETWSEFLSLCETVKSSGIYPTYSGFKDTWTCLAPWNALAVGLAPADTCAKVNEGKTTFKKEYYQVAEKMKTLLNYTEPNPFAYSYNDACTAFARGESAMFIIGNYAVPQIKSVNPDMNIDSFTFPANENEQENVLVSGVDLQFSVLKECKDKDAAYEVLRFLYEDETIQIYLDEQSAISCKEGNFTLPSTLSGMKNYIDEGRMSDYHDHYYPSEMSADAMIQTYLMDKSKNSTEKFLNNFDESWIRYNRDLIKKVQEYKKENS